MELGQFETKKIYERFLNWVIPASVPRMSEAAIELTNLCHLVLLALLFVPAFVVQYLALGNPKLAAMLTSAGIVMCASVILFKKTGKLHLARECFATPLFLFKVTETVLFQGVVSPGTAWFVVLPIIAILLGSVCAAVIWTVIAAVTLVGLHWVLGSNVVFIASPTHSPVFMYIFSLIGLMLAISAFVLMVEQNRKAAFRQLGRANQQIYDIAIHDALTGVHNRYHLMGLMAEIEKECRLIKQDASPVCVCLVDLDKFKAINDTYGHTAGDEVLKAVAMTIKSQVRQGDCFGRYGGEEFLLVIRNTGLEGARQFAERVRRHVAGLTFPSYPGVAHATVSIGIAQYQPDETISTTLDRADHALYQAKASGRNRVMLA